MVTDSILTQLYIQPKDLVSAIFCKAFVTNIHIVQMIVISFVWDPWNLAFESSLQVTVVKFNFPSIVKIFFLWNKYLFFSIIMPILNKFDGLDIKYWNISFSPFLYKRNYVFAHFQRWLQDGFPMVTILCRNISWQNAMQLCYQLNSLSVLQANRPITENLQAWERFTFVKKWNILHSSLQNKQVWYFYRSQ